MAVAFDVAFETPNASATTATANGTVAANSNRLLICAVGWNGNPGAIVSWVWDDGGTNQAMTQIGTTQTNGGFTYNALFYRIAPTTGTKTMRGTWTNSQQSAMGGISLYNCDQTTGVSDFTTATGATSPTTITVPNVAAGDASVGAQSDNDSSSCTIATGVLDYNERTLSGNYAGLHNLGSGVMSTTLGTNQAWVLVGARVIQFGAAADTGLVYIRA